MALTSMYTADMAYRSLIIGKTYSDYTGELCCTYNAMQGAYLTDKASSLYGRMHISVHMSTKKKVELW